MRFGKPSVIGWPDAGGVLMAAFRKHHVKRRRCAPRWRRLTVEQFEPRMLLSGTPQVISQIDADRAGIEVADDGFISTLGAVQIINLVNPVGNTVENGEGEAGSVGVGVPDTMGAVGPNAIVEMLNTTYAVYDKSSRQCVSPAEVSLTRFWNTALATNGAGSEVQQLSVSGAPTDGDFTIAYGQLPSHRVAWDADANRLLTDLQEKLDTLFGAGNATSSAVGANQFDIHFGGQLVGIDLAPLAVSSHLNGGSVAQRTIANGAGNEVQRLKFQGTIQGGEFTLATAGTSPQAVTWNADPNALRVSLQEKLDAMYGIGNVGVLNSANNQFDIIFSGQLAGTNVAPLIVKSALIGTNTAFTGLVSAGDGDEVQRLTFSGPQPDSFIVLQYSGAVSSQIVWDADPALLAARIQEALVAMFGTGNVSVIIAGNNQFDITFRGAMSHVNLSELTAFPRTFNASADVTTIRDGAGNEWQRFYVGFMGSSPFTLSLTLPEGTVITTAPIVLGATEEVTRATIESALTEPSILGPGQVKIIDAGYGWFEAFFGGALSEINVPDLVVTNTVTGKVDSAYTLGNGDGDEVNRLLFSGTINDGSTFRLSLGPLLSASFDYSNTPSQLLMNIQDALDRMLGQGTAVASSSGARQFDIQFGGLLGHVDLPDMTATSNLTGTSPLVQLFTTIHGGGGAVERLSFLSTVNGGSVTVNFPGSGSRTIEFSLDPAALLENVQTVLDSIYGISGTNPVLHNAQAILVFPPQDEYHAAQIDVLFRNQLDRTPVPPWTIVENRLTVSGAVATSTVTDPVPLTSWATDPRVLFDPSSGRWFASALGHDRDRPLRRENVLLAVSNSSDPRDGWKGFAIDPDPNDLQDPDFPQLGVDAEGVYVVVSLLNNQGDNVAPSNSATIISVPKSDLVAVHPTLERMTVLPFLDQLAGALVRSQPVVDMRPADGREPVLSRAERVDILNSAGPGAASIDPAGSIPVQGPFRELELELIGDFVGGSFTLGYSSLPTQTIAWNADMGTLRTAIQAAVDALLGDGNAAVLQVPFPELPNGVHAYLFHIVLSEGLNAAVPTTLKLTSDLIGGYAQLTQGRADRENELQRLSLLGAVVGDSFTLQFPNRVPQIVAWDASPAILRTNLQSAINVLLGAGNAAVLPRAENQFDITFGGQLYHTDVPLIVVDAAETHNAELQIRIATIIDGVDDSQALQKAPQPGTTDLLAIGNSHLYSHVVRQGDSFWMTYAVNVLGRAGIRWVEIDAATTRVKQAGNIGDPELSLFVPSLAVNPDGDVVIGFSGSSSKQYPSAYYVVGHTVEGQTTFGKPRLLQAGSGSFNVRWGDYSATMLDPYDPLLFWTFQEYTVTKNQWGIKIGTIRTDSPNDTDFVMQHNLERPLDVTGDGQVVANDALVIINSLNAFGSVLVPPDSLGGPYFDVDGDGIVAPNDALSVINYINAYGADGAEEPGTSRIQHVIGEGEGKLIETGRGLSFDELVTLLGIDLALQGRRRR